MQKQLVAPNGWQQGNALTALREEAQEKAKPLIEWWNDRNKMEKGINTFFVPFDFVFLKTAEKHVALMDKGYDIFKVIRELQEEIVKPIKQENARLEEQNKKLIEEKNYAFSLLTDFVLGDIDGKSLKLSEVITI